MANVENFMMMMFWILNGIWMEFQMVFFKMELELELNSVCLNL